MAENDPIKIEKFEAMPLLEYWHLLNHKLADTKAQQRNAAKLKQQRNARNTRRTGT